MLDALIDRILTLRTAIRPTRAVLAALSGIDGSGKGWLAGRLDAALRDRGRRTAVINIDGWLNLPAVRFDDGDPAEHFYRHAIRFDELFAQLVLPLRDRRSLRVEVDHAAETATAFVRRTYAFDDVDVILLEGIFLLQPALRAHYDLAVWIDCTFQTALERAVARGQEGLSRADTVRVYRRIYFPAEAIHLARDDPRAAADVVIANDPRLA